MLISALLDPARPASAIGEPWSGRSPSDLGRFLFFLASHEVRSRTGKQGKASLPRTVEETAHFIAPLAFLLDWPTRFDTHVQSRLRNGDVAAPSAAARLGKWYQGFNTFRDPAYEPFRARLALVVAKEFGGPYSARRKRESTNPTAFVSAAEAARRLGVRAERLVVAVREGVVVGEQRRSGFGHTHTVLPAAEVDRLIALRDRGATGADVIELLGVSRKQFDLIRAARVLPELDENGHRLFGAAAYDRTALQERIDFIRQSTAPRSDPGLRFRDINLRKTADRASVHDAIRKIFSGAIRPCSATSDALADFVFSEKELSSVLTCPHDRPHWTVQDVAEIAGWKPEVVAHWCREGFLSAREVSDNRGRSYAIHPRDLARFQSTYVPLSDLAAQIGTSSRTIRASIDRENILVLGEKRSGQATRGGLVRMKDLIPIRTMSEGA